MAAPSTETSRVYVGMLVVTCVAMLIGITAMALESSEYGWEQKPAPTQKVELPKDTPAVAAAPVAGARAPIIVPKIETAALPLPPIENFPAAPAALPQTLPPILLPPIATAESPKPIEVKPPESKPLTTPPTPTPSPLVIPGR